MAGVLCQCHSMGDGEIVELSWSQENLLKERIVLVLPYSSCVLVLACSFLVGDILSSRDVGISP